MQVREIKLLGSESVATQVAVLVGDGFNGNAECAEVVFVALKHSHRGGVASLRLAVGWDFLPQCIEVHRKISAQQGREEIGPALDFGLSGRRHWTKMRAGGDRGLGGGIFSVRPLGELLWK